MVDPEHGHFNCASCRGIPWIPDVNKRIRRNADASTVSSSCRLDYLPQSELLLRAARALRVQNRKLCLENLRLSTRLSASRLRSMALRDRLFEFTARGDIASIAKDLTAAHASGALEGKETLIALIRDLCHSVMLGRSCKNMRWSSQAMQCFQVLYKLGGPRVMRCFTATLAGPHMRTIEKRWAKHKVLPKLGLDQDLMQLLAPMYQDLMKKHGITGPVFAEHQI